MKPDGIFLRYMFTDDHSHAFIFKLFFYIETIYKTGYGVYYHYWSSIIGWLQAGITIASVTGKILGFYAVSVLNLHISVLGACCSAWRINSEWKVDTRHSQLSEFFSARVMFTGIMALLKKLFLYIRYKVPSFCQLVGWSSRRAGNHNKREVQHGVFNLPFRPNMSVLINRLLSIALIIGSLYIMSVTCIWFPKYNVASSVGVTLKPSFI